MTTTTVARDILASGECTAACLLAWAPHGPGCDCRCGGRLHGTMAGTEVPGTSVGVLLGRAPRSEEESDRWYTLPGRSRLHVTHWREWTRRWTTVELDREIHVRFGREDGTVEPTTSDDVTFLVWAMRIHAMARCFDRAYPEAIMLGGGRDWFTLTLWAGDAPMVIDALVDLDQTGNPAGVITYLRTPCRWRNCAPWIDEEREDAGASIAVARQVRAAHGAARAAS